MARSPAPSPKQPVHTLSYRVLYGDTDAGGVVYYGTYMRFLELGRTEYLRSVLGITCAELVEQGTVFPVVELQCRYHSPARYDDLLKIETWVDGVTAATIRFGYLISRDGRPVLTGSTVNASVGPGGRPRRLPSTLAQRLQRVLKLEG